MDNIGTSIIGMLEKTLLTVVATLTVIATIQELLAIFDARKVQLEIDGRLVINKIIARVRTPRHHYPQPPVYRDPTPDPRPTPPPGRGNGGGRRPGNGNGGGRGNGNGRRN